jgi:AraC-like DNA-binding protein
MNPIREILPEGSPFGIACFEQKKVRFDHDYHHHPEIEITSIRSSEGRFLIGDAVCTFRSHDLFILGSNLPHRFKNWSDGLASSRIIQFRKDAFGDDFFELDGFAKVRNLFKAASRGLLLRGPAAARASSRIDKVFQHKDQPTGLANLLLLLERLSQESEAQPLCGSSYAPDLDTVSTERLSRVLSYIDRQWNQPLSLDELARVAALHPQSLSRFFRKHLGVTFQSYLIRFRISHAARKLIESDASVTEIALASGFENMANFHRHFRRAYGTSPSLYRKNFD